MKNQKFTPGPWHVSYSEKHGTYYVEKSTGQDARLIAAAPELLEALEHCIAYFKAKRPVGCGVDDDRDCSPFNDAIQAIAKATGGVK